MKLKREKILLKKIVNTLLLLIMQTKSLLHYLHCFGASYATVVGIPAGIAGASLTLIFTVTTGVVKTLLNITRKKKKKHNKIIVLARSKLNIIANLISQALIDFEITHEEFSKIIFEKNNYEQIIDNIRSVKSINDLNKENN